MAQTRQTSRAELRAGAIIWFLIVLNYQQLFAALWNLSKNLSPGVANVLGSAVIGAIGGGVIGQVLGLMNKRSV